MKYFITGYQKGDETKISNLFSDVFEGRVFDIENWVKSQNANPYRNYVVASMWNNDLMIAHAELRISKAFLNKQEVLSGTSCTFMANKKYPGAGVTIYKWIDKQYPDIFKIGFPNDHALPVVKNVLKHNYVGDIDFWWKKPSMHKTNDYNGFQWERMIFPSNDCDFTRECMEFQYSLIRDKKYIEWRFFSCNQGKYEYFECRENEILMGYAVLSLYEEQVGEEKQKHGQIVDIISRSVTSMEYMLDKIDKYFGKRKVEIIKLWMSDPEIQIILRQQGYQYGLRPFHVELWHHNLKISNMYLTMADSDIF